MIVPSMKRAIVDTFEALFSEVDEMDTICNQFELFGYDFMISEDLSVYLIEVNTNPCLETEPCSLLQRLIPQVLD